jgi:hypothetical protein
MEGAEKMLSVQMKVRLGRTPPYLAFLGIVVEMWRLFRKDSLRQQVESELGLARSRIDAINSKRHDISA